MAKPIMMPKFGQMTEVSTIVEWKKKEGDRVSRGDVLFTVETDKSVMEVEAFVEGVLLKIVVPAGVSVPVNTIVGFIGEPGEPVPDIKPMGANSPQPKEVLHKKETAYVMADSRTSKGGGDRWLGCTATYANYEWAGGNPACRGCKSTRTCTRTKTGY